MWIKVCNVHSVLKTKGTVCPVRLQRVDGGPGSNGNAVFLVDDLIYALVVELVDFDVAGTVAKSVL